MKTVYLSFDKRDSRDKQAVLDWTDSGCNPTHMDNTQMPDKNNEITDGCTW